MKAFIRLIAAIIVLGATPSLAAKGDKSISLQLGGLVPTGDYRRSADPGFEGRLVGTYMESDHVGIGADVAYHRWKASDDANAYASALFGPGSEITYDGVQVTPHVLYDFRAGGDIRPYAKAGAGLYSVRSKLVTPFGSADDRSWNFSYSLGAGIEVFDNPRYGVGLGGMYHIIQAGDAKPRLFTVGLILAWRLGAH